MAREPSRSTTGAFTREQQELFLSGQWVATPDSTRVVRARHVEAASRLEVVFTDGTLWAYPCSAQKALSFALAGSKGGWITDYMDRAGVRGGRL